MADHLELVAEIPKVEKLCVQDRLELARKRRSQQLKRWDREKDEELGPPPPKKKPLRARPVKFEPRIILLEAASRGDGDEVKKMLDYGVDPNLSNDDGLTALHQACIDECEDIAALLVEYGADIDAYDRELWTPLHASAACGNFSMIEYLVDQGANVAAINADGNLPVDLVEDDKELKDYLYDELDKHGFDEDKIDELMIQREHWMMEDIQDAIEKKRDLEIKDMEGATALHVAAANGYMEVLEFLLEHDADVDVKDKDGWMPIHAAGCWGNEKAIELLVEHGADIDSKTPRGESPLDLCEDADTRQFIIDLKNKMKTNKFKVKKTRRQRSNSRSLSVKRSSLKEKISISQSEAKAEAIMRKHPELAFLIQNDKKSNGEPKPEDINIDEKNGKHREETVSPEKTHVPTDERKPLSKESSNVNERTSTTTTTTTITTKPEGISENREKRLVDIKVVVKGTEEKENKPLVEPKNRELPKLEQYKGPEPRKREATVQEKHVTPTQDIKTTDVQSKNQPAPKESILQERTNIAPSEFSKTHGPPKCPPPRSPTLGHRQLPADPTPKLPQTAKENEATKNNQLGQGAVISKVQKAPTPKPLSEVSLNKKTTEGSPTPKSSKTRAAPPVPRSSGSASGRSQVPLINSSSDTSGYPESFSKRKSRDSRELSDATMQQLAKDVKESRAASISDVKMTSHTARYTPKPPTPPQQPQRNDVATLDVHSDTANAKQTSAESNNTNINNQPKEPVDKISAQANVKVERQKKSCCILM